MPRHSRTTSSRSSRADLGEDTTFDFTGTALTVTQIATHSRTEAAIHRWDITGSDNLSEELLAQPELTRHAVSVLNAMPILNESARARATQGHLLPLRIVLRAAGQLDVVLAADVDGNAHFELAEEGTAAQGDAVVSTDPAHRLLVLWGRRSSKHPVTIEADGAISDAVSSVLWPSAIPWH